MATNAAFEIHYILHPPCNVLQVDVRRNFTARRQALSDGGNMAQLIESSFICDARFRLLTIQPMGRKIGRIIEIEEVDTRERIHGTARRLDRLALALRRSHSEADAVAA